MQAGTPPNTTTKYSSQLIEGSLTEIRVMAIEQVQLTNQRHSRVSASLEVITKFVRRDWFADTRDLKPRRCSQHKVTPPSECR